MRPTDTTVEGRLDELRNRVQLRTRIRRAFGEPLWEQLAKEARASADEFGLDDLDSDTQRIIARTTPYTKTPPVRVVALCNAVDYVVRHEIPGAIVECGLWRGGSLMAAALRLGDLGATDRPLYGFDTFAGMTPPTEHDGPRQMNRWRKAGVPMDQWPENLAPGTSLEGVAALLASTNYGEKEVHLVKGPVEETLPEKARSHVCVLRLDTDSYESTIHELNHLYPRLSRFGVLIIDDYGNLAGARKAVDEYFSERRIFMHRIDHGARIAIKQE